MIYVLSSKKKSRMGNGEMLITGYATKLWREDGSERKRLEGRVSKYHWTQSSLKGWLVCNSESRSLSVGLFVKGMGGSGVIRRAQQGTCEEGGGY